MSCLSSMALCLYFCTSFCLGFFVFLFSFWFCVSQYYGRIFPLLLVLWQKLSPFVNIWHWPWETDEVSRNLMVGKSISYRLLLLTVPEYSHHRPTVIQTTPSILSNGLHTKLLLWRCRFLCNFRDMLRCFLIWYERKKTSPKGGVSGKNLFPPASTCRDSVFHQMLLWSLLN